MLAIHKLKVTGAYNEYLTIKNDEFSIFLKNNKIMKKLQENLFLKNCESIVYLF